MRVYQGDQQLLFGDSDFAAAIQSLPKRIEEIIYQIPEHVFRLLSDGDLATQVKNEVGVVPLGLDEQKAEIAHEPVTADVLNDPFRVSSGARQRVSGTRIRIGPFHR